jgi:glycosyltransferase involved in cell wall biosynthesis
MLEPWSLQQKRLKKRMARWLYQDDDLKNAAALHATAESEAGQFRRLGFANKVIVSPNGVNLPENFNSAGHAGEDKRILFVGRMHPKKGVLELVEALSRCFNGSKGLDDWKAELVYTVNGEEEHEYESTIKRRVEELGLADRFIYTGALGDDEKWAAYTRADLFALPTYSENFGIVVAEALWAGVPVVTTKGTPWSELADRKCGWWIDAGVGPLTEALSGAMALTDAERREMGLRGRSLIEEKYTWEAVVKRLVAGYESIVI